LLINVNSIFISKGAFVTISDLVSLYVNQASYVDVQATLLINAYIGAFDGPGALIVYGNLLLLAGNIQGSGNLIIQSTGVFNISSVHYNYTTIREAYLMKNVTIAGNAYTLAGAIIHAGFWWQPVNLSITVASGGTLRFGGYFSKHFESWGIDINQWAFGSNIIYVNPGGTLHLGYQELFLATIINNGTLYSPVQLTSNATNYAYYFPWGLRFFNYGTVYYSPVTDDLVPQHIGIGTCEELRKFMEFNKGEPLTIFVDIFAKLGPLNCDISLELHDTTLRFIGHGGLIFDEHLHMQNVVLEVDPDVDVVFLQEFYAKDTTLVVPKSSNVKLMFMPKGFPDGYHNYMDKSVLFWPEGEKKIHLDNVNIIGGGGIDFLSEANLEGGGLIIKQGEVYFQREYFASAITGAGNLVVLENGMASFGIESVLNGTGLIEVFGKAEVPKIATVRSERQFVVHEGADWNVLGQFTQL